MTIKVIFAVVLVNILGYNEGREVTKSIGYNQNSDFLLHESGFPPLGPQNKPNPSSISQSLNPLHSDNFPPLNPAQNTPGRPASSTGGKRDYVAPQWTTPRPASGSAPTAAPVTSTKPTSTTGRRDYVAPVKPQVPTNTGEKQNPNLADFPPLTPSSVTTSKPTTGKRDYVSPNWPGLPQPSASNKPSSKPAAPTPSTTKMPSFSSVLNGPGKPGAGRPSPSPTSKPQSPVTFKPMVPTVIPNNKPGNTVLPSSLLNQNSNKVINGVSDSELVTLSEELLRRDANNAAKYITVSFQERTTSFSTEDKAPQPLLNIPTSVWNMPTIQKFLPLLDNYEWDTLVNEHVTPQERTEENVFMDTIMATNVIRHLMTFLREKGFVTPDPRQQRDFLKQLWFTLYSRGKGKIGSSGFEHIFVSELKNNEVSGLHNWIYFAKEESANRVNYLGYLKYENLNDKGALLKMHFNQRGKDKPVDTMFIGTSPELEMALYTLCFVTRADKDCNLKLAGKNVKIVTHTFRYRSRNLIGSAYPQF